MRGERNHSKFLHFDFVRTKVRDLLDCSGSFTLEKQDAIICVIIIIICCVVKRLKVVKRDRHTWSLIYRLPPSKYAKAPRYAAQA